MTMIPIPAHLEPVLAEYAKAQGVTVEQLAVAALEKEFIPPSEDAELHPDWAEISNRRAAEIDSGAEVGIPMEQAFSDARAALRRGQRAAG